MKRVVTGNLNPQSCKHMDLHHKLCSPEFVQRTRGTAFTLHIKVGGKKLNIVIRLNRQIHDRICIPIGLYLSIREFTAQLGPKYLIADLT